MALTQLVDRLPKEHVSQQAVSLGPVGIKLGSGLTAKTLPSFGAMTALSAPFVARALRKLGTGLVHAWGVEAAAAASAGSTGPLVLEMFDPIEATTRIKLIRTLVRARGFAIACGCQIVRRRLIEGGVSPEACVVIRPGVDFGAINQWKRGGLREELGIGRDETMILVPEPVTSAGGQLDAYFAASMLVHLGATLRVVVSGGGRGREGIANFSKGLLEQRSLVLPDPSIPFEELMAVADVLVVAPRGDHSTTAIAWAMASNVLVIGTAVYSVAELISHKVNGLLYKQTMGRSMLPGLAKLLAGVSPISNVETSKRRNVEKGMTETENAPSSADLLHGVGGERIDVVRLKQTAHGQAYEVFGLRRFVEQHLRLYRNLMEGVAPGEGIVDSAMAV